MDKAIILEGKYKGSIIEGLKGEMYLREHNIYLNKRRIQSYQVLWRWIHEYEYYLSKGNSNVVAFGGLDAITEIGIKNKSEYLIIIKWNDGENSLISMDRYYYRKYFSEVMIINSEWDLSHIKFLIKNLFSNKNDHIISCFEKNKKITITAEFTEWEKVLAKRDNISTIRQIEIMSESICAKKIIKNFKPSTIVQVVVVSDASYICEICGKGVDYAYNYTGIGHLCLKCMAKVNKQNQKRNEEECKRRMDKRLELSPFIE